MPLPCKLIFLYLIWVVFALRQMDLTFKCLWICSTGFNKTILLRGYSGQRSRDFFSRVYGERRVLCSYSKLSKTSLCMGDSLRHNLAKNAIQWPFSQKFLRSIMLVRENLRFCSFSQKFIREICRTCNSTTVPTLS